MTVKETRREIIRKFKEKRPEIGIYAVRCIATGRAWVGASRNLGATNNGCWFCLRGGTHQCKSLQEEWNTHGKTSFRYEILDRLDEDVHPLEIGGLLKGKKSDWTARLEAQPLL